MSKTKERIIRETSMKVGISERVVETIINHQFYSILEAMDTSHSIELCGFGNFMFNTNKALKKFAKLNKKADDLEHLLASPDSTPAQIAKWKAMLISTHNQIKKLKPTIQDELQANI